MATLDQLEKKFKRPAKTPEPADSLSPLKPLAVFEVPTCSECGQSEFWKTHHDQDDDLGRCVECEPPVSMALVAEEYFYDDQTGYRWLVEKVEGGEWCRRVGDQSKRFQAARVINRGNDKPY